MESLEHKSPNISLPNCSKMLIFGKEAFFIMLFANIFTNPIISIIEIFVMSHLSDKMLTVLVLHHVPRIFTNSFVDKK